MKKVILLSSLLAGTGYAATACVTCNKEVRAAIWDDSFAPNLLTMLSAFIVIAVVVLLLTRMSARSHRVYSRSYPGQTLLTPVPMITAAMVLGIGVGGFIDGIVLHQILQWHEMLSNKLRPDTVVAKSVNMFWDGVFHAFTLLVTLTGIVLLWRLSGRRDADRSGYLLGGGMLLGWGLFNIVEGIIDHHLLKLHNVREVSEDPSLWNFGFLGLSVVMVLAGAALAYRRRPVPVGSAG